jgi:WD domain, G-beta repeat
MADPLSAQSEWVQKEVTCWVAMRRTEKMLIVWTGGDLIWDKARKDFAWDKTTALPSLLARTFEGEEPLYQDLRWAKRKSIFLANIHSLLAHWQSFRPLSEGKAPTKKFGEDVREQRRSLRFLWAGITILLLAILLASWGWRAEFQARNAADEQTRIANEQRIKAEEQTRIAEEQARIANVRRLVAESSSAFAKYPQRGLLLAVEAAKAVQSLHGDRVAAAEQSLREVLASMGGRPVARADGPITAVAISPDNRWLVSGSDDQTARLWDLSAKDPAAKPLVLRGHYGKVNAVAISPDNRWLVTGSDDQTARLWDLSAKDPGAKPVVLHGHYGRVNAVAISPDNRWVVTGGDDHTARLWDLSAKDPGAKPVILRGHNREVWAVAISPDNRREV